MPLDAAAAAVAASDCLLYSALERWLLLVVASSFEKQLITSLQVSNKHASSIKFCLLDKADKYVVKTSLLIFNY